MLTETFNIVGAQGNFLKFVCYFILLYVFIYFKLNELFLKKIYDNDLGVDIFGTSDKIRKNIFFILYIDRVYPSG